MGFGNDRFDPENERRMASQACPLDDCHGAHVANDRWLTFASRKYHRTWEPYWPYAP